MMKKTISVIIVVLVIANIALACTYFGYEEPERIQIPCRHEFLPVTAFLQEDGTVQCLFGRIIDV